MASSPTSPLALSSPSTPILLTPSGDAYVFGNSIGAGTSKKATIVQAVRDEEDIREIWKSHQETLEATEPSKPKDTRPGSALLYKDPSNLTRSPTQRAMSILELSLDEETASREHAQIAQEISILKLCEKLKIDGVLRLEKVEVIKDTRQVFLLTPLCEGGKLQNIRQNSEKSIHQTLLNIAKTIEKLHKNKIVHGDIKPDNILLKNGKPMIIDFGCSYLVGDGVYDGKKYPKPEHCEGTIAYRSLYPREVYESPESRDIFAFGATIYQILAGNSLADDVCSLMIEKMKLNPQEITVNFFFKTNATDAFIQEVISKNVADPEAQDLLHRMLFCNSVNPSENDRPKELWSQANEFTIKEVLNHQYFKDSES
jgi:serine/threonine protein kinase